MNCHTARELIDPFVDRELDPATAEEIRRHFRECEPCHSVRCDLLILSSSLKEDSLYYFAPKGLLKRIRLSLRAAVA